MEMKLCEINAGDGEPVVERKKRWSVDFFARKGPLAQQTKRRQDRKCNDKLFGLSGGICRPSGRLNAGKPSERIRNKSRSGFGSRVFFEIRFYAGVCRRACVVEPDYRRCCLRFSDTNTL